MCEIIISHILNLSLLLFLRKIIITFTMILPLFFLSVLQKNFDVCLKPFFTFFLFLPQKYFDIFHVRLFEAFLCFFYDTYLPFLYIEKKSYKKVFFYLSFMNHSKHSLHCFKLTFSIFKSFSKNTQRYIKTENLSYKIA